MIEKGKRLQGMQMLHQVMHLLSIFDLALVMAHSIFTKNPIIDVLSSTLQLLKNFVFEFAI